EEGRRRLAEDEEPEGHPADPGGDGDGRAPGAEGVDDGDGPPSGAGQDAGGAAPRGGGGGGGGGAPRPRASSPWRRRPPSPGPRRRWSARAGDSPAGRPPPR